MTARSLGKLERDHVVVMICDLQERFRASILYFDDIVQNTDKLAKVSQLLSLPVIATEQYPKV